ncbi:MAG TPA: extracellular solute-binding protein [Kineosporiaceae bacterium]|nr:extracellular solute-binding protein [Kineosporiaceae bacterium]
MKITGKGAVSLVAVLGLLTGCQSSARLGDVPAGATSGSPDGPCWTSPPGPVQITLATHASDNGSAATNPITLYRTLIDKFNATVGKQQAITVTLVSYPEVNYEHGLTRAIEAGQVPDVLEVDAPFVATFAYRDLIRTLGNCVSAEKLSTLIPSVIANGRYQGQQYTLGAYDSGMGLWANKAALQKVHARIPTSAADAWGVEEFDTILKELQAYGYPTPLNIEWSDGAAELRPFAFGPVLLSAGTDLLTPDGRSADGALNSPQAQWALNWFQSWGRMGMIDLDSAPGSNDRNFVDGRSAISWVGHWAGDMYRKALGDNLILLPLPNFGHGSAVYTGSWSFALSAKTAHPQAAWTLIDYLTGPEAAKALADAESAIPAVKADLAADPVYQPGGQRYLYVQNLNDPKVARPRPATPVYLAARDQFSLAFGNIVQGLGIGNALQVAVDRIAQDVRLNRGYPDS